MPEKNSLYYKCTFNSFLEANKSKIVLNHTCTLTSLFKIKQQNLTYTMVTH